MLKEQFMTETTLEDLNKKNLNTGIAFEFIALGHNYLDISNRFLTEHINELRHISGRKVRSERRESMIAVMNVLYSYLNLDKSHDKFGECSPSMRTIAYKLDKSLERPAKSDTPAKAKKKERKLMTVVMKVQRTIDLLKEFNLITIHEYRSSTNRYEDKNTVKLPNFYYQFTMISFLSPSFKRYFDQRIIKLFKSPKEVKRLKNKAQDSFKPYLMFLLVAKEEEKEAILEDLRERLKNRQELIEKTNRDNLRQQLLLARKNKRDSKKKDETNIYVADKLLIYNIN